ncbi:MAG: phosphoribosylanthranilate isomerase [Gammaproteobacteria bacterium]|jgi:phosphoribosylanthranilate isomerase|nr:phosphoribosylanthranilate isomerase [Gammaproteobacteria bacterium]
MTLRIKICGIARVEDARAAAAAGADAIGLVFHRDSPRAVDIRQGLAIVAALPPFVSVVGLFVDADPDHVREVITELRPHYLQFHGSESGDYCRKFGLPYIKAVAVTAGMDESAVAAGAAGYPDAAAILLDSGSGGSGEAFDWNCVPAHRDRPLVLAGGLRPENVAQAVRQVRPDAVDVSSGVEKVRGRKDADMMAAFIAQARQALDDT